MFNNLRQAWKVLFPKRSRKRICANCGKQIKRGEKFSAAHHEDRKPRHHDCITVKSKANA